MEAAGVLKSYRANSKLTQQGLADMLKVRRETVARWESGERKPDRDLLSEITAKTGIPARDLRPDLVEEAEKLLAAPSNEAA